ncbi:competence protein CoiA [Streptococcus porcinus]|uniref:Competence protein CoiA-like family protein n=2 Tax=Streptococcus porcinus TaxID=1340 RepID=A0A4V0H0I2_STRPO|nr:competence protein CoiA family protein [Streptococcus porcinus]EGJ27670.1 competence protein CoiA-like protein [Streptococcus porcinus str. Jelinkova 176]SQG43347.1 competence protein CoiA-like family protein [Streptococcus porcinus]VTT42544.1 competence protein CoiA-like family protein [Streptococcus porcinus]VTT44004.1 competence protein CoiA-like family protein [Streptococcus porcinus]
MLKAVDSYGKTISLLEKVPDKGDFYCPLCRGKLCLKKGKVIRPHFAHLNLRNCHFFQENESVEHLTLKALVYNSLRPLYNVEIEKYIETCCQVSDIMVNHKLALEIQCSPLPIERLMVRTSSYQEKGFSVRWLLGQKLWLRNKLTALQKQFLYYSKTHGFHLWELDVKKREIRLQYMIHLNLFGKVYFQTEAYSLTDDLLAVLSLPYKGIPANNMKIYMQDEIKLSIQKALRKKNAYWMKEQEKAYLKGDNLLARQTEDFYPQLYPPRSNVGFCQTKMDYLSDYRRFCRYYKNIKNKKVQTIHPPLFYDKIGEKKI